MMVLGPILTVPVEYHESGSECQRDSESGILLSRIIILLAPFIQLTNRGAVTQSHNQSIKIAPSLVKPCYVALNMTGSAVFYAQTRHTTRPTR
jgi:hypothetical protein